MNRQILVELDANLAASLERVAPARSRQRSEFIRAAIRRAIWEIEERRTAEAYARIPDTEPRESLEPSMWSPSAPTPRRRKPRAR